MGDLDRQGSFRAFVGDCAKAVAIAVVVAAVIGAADRALVAFEAVSLRDGAPPPASERQVTPPSSRAVVPGAGGEFADQGSILRIGLATALAIAPRSR